MPTIEPFVIERTYQATAARVWKAITNKHHMKQWYFDVSDFKPETGFEFTFEGQNEGRVFVHLCKVLEVEPCKKIAYSWQYQGFEGYSVVTFQLFDDGNETRLTLTHTGLETFPAGNSDFDKENFAMGWTYIVGTSLPAFLEKAAHE